MLVKSCQIDHKQGFNVVLIALSQYIHIKLQLLDMKRSATSLSGRDSGTRIDRLLFVWLLCCCRNIKVELSCSKSTFLLSLLCHSEKSGGMLYGKWSEFTSINQMQCYFVRVFVFIHGHSGALGSFAIVREGNDESLIKSRPQRSELPDLRQAQNENSIHSFLFFMNICTSLSWYYYSYKTCLERILRQYVCSLSARRVITVVVVLALCRTTVWKFVRDPPSCL